MAESDNENAYQDSSVMFSALNRLESTEMCNCKKSRCLKLYAANLAVYIIVNNEYIILTTGTVSALQQNLFAHHLVDASHAKMFQKIQK